MCILVASNTRNHVVTIHCHLIGGYFLDFNRLPKCSSVVKVDSLDLFITQTPLIPCQVTGRVVVPQLFRGKKKFTTQTGTTSQMNLGSIYLYNTMRPKIDKITCSFTSASNCVVARMYNIVVVHQ